MAVYERVGKALDHLALHFHGYVVKRYIRYRIVERIAQLVNWYVRQWRNVMSLCFTQIARATIASDRYANNFGLVFSFVSDKLAMYGD